MFAKLAKWWFTHSYWVIPARGKDTPGFLRGTKLRPYATVQAALNASPRLIKRGRTIRICLAACSHPSADFKIDKLVEDRGRVELIGSNPDGSPVRVEPEV
jgi:hypothetical protein